MTLQLTNENPLFSSLVIFFCAVREPLPGLAIESRWQYCKIRRHGRLVLMIGHNHSFPSCKCTHFIDKPRICCSNWHETSRESGSRMEEFQVILHIPRSMIGRFRRRNQLILWCSSLWNNAFPSYRTTYPELPRSPPGRTEQSLLRSWKQLLAVPLHHQGEEGVCSVANHRNS